MPRAIEADLRLDSRHLKDQLRGADSIVAHWHEIPVHGCWSKRQWGTSPVPRSAADRRKPMQFPNASATAANMLYPQDGSAFDVLARFIAHEYADPAAMEMRGVLAALGIEKGRPFNPDSRTRDLLDRGAKTAFRMGHSIIYEPLSIVPNALWYKDRRWANVFPGNATFTADSFNDIDPRTGFFTVAYSTSPGMATNMVNVGAKYPVTFVDSEGGFLRGSNTYKLNLPKDIPAALFWSVTVYDAVTGAGLDNGQAFPSLNTMDKPSVNADASTDIYFAPASPGTGKNWVRTVPDKGFFVILRIYGPKQEFFDQSWKPGDIEKVSERAADGSTKITEEYTKLVARDAYFWAWPVPIVFRQGIHHDPAEHGLDGLLILGCVVLEYAWDYVASFRAGAEYFRNTLGHITAANLGPPTDRNPAWCRTSSRAMRSCQCASPRSDIPRNDLRNPGPGSPPATDQARAIPRRRQRPGSGRPPAALQARYSRQHSQTIQRCHRHRPREHKFRHLREREAPVVHVHLTFPKGATPPVNGFWSLTLYNEHHFFAPNELNRYSVGTKNKALKYNPDGSLTIYVTG